MLLILPSVLVEILEMIQDKLHLVMWSPQRSIRKFCAKILKHLTIVFQVNKYSLSVV